MYQTREGGAIRSFDSTQELFESSSTLATIDKLSFDGPDGRIRLLNVGAGLFRVTIWNGTTFKYFPYEPDYTDV